MSLSADGNPPRRLQPFDESGHILVGLDGNRSGGKRAPSQKRRRLAQDTGRHNSPSTPAAQSRPVRPAPNDDRSRSAPPSYRHSRPAAQSSLAGRYQIESPAAPRAERGTSQKRDPLEAAGRGGQMYKIDSARIEAAQVGDSHHVKTDWKEI